MMIKLCTMLSFRKEMMKKKGSTDINWSLMMAFSHSSVKCQPSTVIDQKIIKNLEKSRKFPNFVQSNLFKTKFLQPKFSRLGYMPSNLPSYNSSYTPIVNGTAPSKTHLEK